MLRDPLRRRKVCAAVNSTSTVSLWIKRGSYLLVAVFAIAATFFAVNYTVADLKSFLIKYELPGLVICFFMYGLLGVTLIPSEPLTLLVLAWEGPTAAILLATLGNTLAALEEFYIGGSIGDLTAFEKRKENLPFHLGRIPINSPVFLLIARMLPGFGPKFVSIACGVYRVPLTTFIWTTLLSNLIGAVFLVLGALGVIELAR
jgi:uncharacterized membrane protein YdjX (TVP38/TMEM64 family)